MAITQADVDALDRAIVDNVLTVRTNDRTVIYRSMDELMTARSHAVSVLAAQSNRAGPRHQLADFSDD